jgi:cell division protein ZipA
MSDANLIRLVILVAGLLWLAFIWWSWQRKHAQAKPTRRPGRKPDKAGGRTEPVLGDDDAAVAFDADAPSADDEMRAELERLGREIADRRQGDLELDLEPLEPLDEDDSTDAPPGQGIRDEAEAGEAIERAKTAPKLRREPVGQRPDSSFDRIITLHVVARDGETIAGPELVVAAERSGLTFGDMDIFHRMVDGYAERGPIFSVVNMMRPGSFDMAAIQDLRTPGVTFFMTLPGPLRAIDAWDTMLPAAQRFADLLDAQVLDEQRNALARQTIQLVREEMRAWDRERERQTIRRSW